MAMISKRSFVPGFIILQDITYFRCQNERENGYTVNSRKRTWIGMSRWKNYRKRQQLFPT
jgi:hypothetical protein